MIPSDRFSQGKWPGSVIGLSNLRAKAVLVGLLLALPTTTVGAKPGPTAFTAVPGTPQSSSSSQLQEAEHAFAEDRLGDARQFCMKAIEQHPKSYQAYYLLGSIQRRLGKMEEARRAWERAVQLQPGYYQARLALAYLYLQIRDLPAAAGEFQAATRLGDPHGRAQYGLALALAGQSKFTEALPALEKSVTAEPNDPQRLFSLTAAEFKLKHAARARAHLPRLDDLSARDPLLLFRIGQMLLDNQMPREAETDFQRCASLLEHSHQAAPQVVSLPELYLQIGQLRFNRSNYLGAREYLKKVSSTAVDPALEAARLDLLGATYLALGSPRQALQFQARAVRLAPNSPDYTVHLVWSQLLSGDLLVAEAGAKAARARWPNNPQIAQLAAIMSTEALPARRAMPYGEAWHLKGEGMVCCPCKMPCPCRSNCPPTYGHCESTGAFRIEDGHYGSVSLDGLTFVVISPGMETQSVPAVFYVDSSATIAQMIALERILQQFDPLQQNLGLDVHRVKISYERLDGGKVYWVRVPGTVEMKIERQTNSFGQPLIQTAGLDFFSNLIEYARNLIYKVSDPKAGLKWDYSGRQANFRTIDLDSSAYHNGRMLIQYHDNAGYFTARMLELIRNQKLPMLSHYPRPAAVDARQPHATHLPRAARTRPQ